MTPLGFLLCAGMLLLLVAICGYDACREVLADFWASLGRSHAGVPPSAEVAAETVRERSRVDEQHIGWLEDCFDLTWHDGGVR